jgi:2-keto-3-deoxy-L-rhamnonate aldolase RhmA
MIEKSAKNENGPGQSKISIDNDQQISAQNATLIHRIEPLAHEIIREGKTIMILPNDKASYTQDIGETNVGPSQQRESLLQRIQMDEPVLGASAISLEILWNHLE